MTTAASGDYNKQTLLDRSERTTERNSIVRSRHPTSGALDGNCSDGTLELVIIVLVDDVDSVKLEEPVGSSLEFELLRRRRRALIWNEL